MITRRIIDWSPYRGKALYVPTVGRLCCCSGGGSCSSSGGGGGGGGGGGSSK